jgi:hypothetical protein
MKHTDLKQNEITDDSLIGLSAELKELSNEEKSSHEGKDTNFAMSSNPILNNFLLTLKEGVKKENASGTGYLCDDDDGRDDDFQG